MVRRFRLYGKKRGNRRTGSRRLGGYGEAFFFGAFLLLGTVGGYVLVTRLILPEWIANRHFIAHECKILEVGVGANGEETLFRPEVTIEYVVDGQTYRCVTYDVHHVYSLSKEEAQKAIAPFVVGEPYRCWYDPEDVESVILIRGYNWWMWLLLVVPAPFVLIGGGGMAVALLHAGTSAERRAALAHRAAQVDLFDDGSVRGLDFPTVPQNMLVTDSPGTRLAYRLPLDAAPGWTLLGIVLVGLVWNGIVAWFLGVAVSQRNWLLLAAFLPFAAVGAGILYLGVRQWFRIAAIGATRIEISAHPLYPGQEYEVFFSQTGSPLEALRLALVCEEQATYRQGTNARTETARVFQQEIYTRHEVAIEPGMSFEDTCRFTVPQEAMHSFQSPHNQIHWKLVVEGDIPNWPDYQRQFPLVVYPAPTPR